MRRLAVSLTISAALFGCGAGQAGTLRSGSALSVSFEDSPSDEYEARVRGDGARGRYVGTIRDAVHLASERRGVILEGDPRLARLAELVEPHLLEGGKLPPAETILFLARHLGLTFPQIHSLLVGTPAVQEIGASVANGVESYLERAPYDAYGAYTFERDGLTITIVLLAHGRVELEPFPREVADGAELRVRGRLVEGLRDPELVLVHPSGESERVSLGEGRRIDGAVRLRGPGVARVQILARGEGGSSPVATAPVAVGVEHERSLVRRAEGNSSGSPAADAVEGSLFRLLLEARREAGRPPLALDDRLTELARAHSIDMREASFIGHTSPSHGDPAERLERAGVRSGLVLENVGRGPTASSIHEGLVASPAHHRNLLNPDVTHVGIGVEPDGRGDFLVTQIFIRRSSTADLALARKKLIDAINRERAARGAPPVSSEPNLERAAERGAKAYFEDASLDERGAIALANDAVEQLGVVFSGVGSVMTVVDAIEQAYRLEPAFDPGVRHVGVGLAQGERPGAPPNSIAVIVLLGRER